MGPDLWSRVEKALVWARGAAAGEALLLFQVRKEADSDVGGRPAPLRKALALQELAQRRPRRWWPPGDRQFHATPVSQQAVWGGSPP